MSDKYSSDFKAKVALAAIAESREVIQEIAEKYNVSEEEIIEWSTQLNAGAASVFSAKVPEATSESHGDAHHAAPEGEDVEIALEDDDTIVSIGSGVMSDELNYSKLIFWSSFGTALVVIFVISLVYFSQYSLFEIQKEVSSESIYYDITALEAEQEEQLNSYGVIDPEQGIYRIPIDSAITKIAE
ncbi:hypothetical protein AB2B38_008665 [Balneola sp. MJW-20]|uniref:hypothetical protein n=1 Tax=Gracilimonas aurantiaca TaxID=3234185 RepID=UPI003465BAD8